jgi:hypothetical protein
VRRYPLTSSSAAPRAAVARAGGEDRGSGTTRCLGPLRPEDQSAERAFLGEPTVRDALHVLVVADEDTVLPRGVLEVHSVRGSLGVEIDRANKVPAAPTKGEDQRTVDVGVGMEREATGHYRLRDSAQDLSAASSASISSRLS